MLGYSLKTLQMAWLGDQVALWGEDAHHRLGLRALHQHHCHPQPSPWGHSCSDWPCPGKDTMNCAEKAMKISHLNPNQSAPSIYIMIELCYFSLAHRYATFLCSWDVEIDDSLVGQLTNFSLDQWEIRLHLLWGKSFNIPHCCDPHLNQTKFNDLLPLTIHGVLVYFVTKTTKENIQQCYLLCLHLPPPHTHTHEKRKERKQLQPQKCLLGIVSWVCLYAAGRPYWRLHACRWSRGKEWSDLDILEFEDHFCCSGHLLCLLL